MLLDWCHTALFTQSCSCDVPPDEASQNLALTAVKADTQAKSAQQPLSCTSSRISSSGSSSSGSSGSSNSSSSSSTEVPKHSTPKAADWLDIELVASRACVLLHWALLPRVLQARFHDASDLPTQLVCQLLGLIQQLIHGHLWDMHLNMTSIFKCGLHAVLAAHLYCGDEEVISAISPSDRVQVPALAAAMLSRLALDSALLPTPANFSLLSEASQETTEEIAGTMLLIAGEPVVLFVLQ